MSAEGSEAIHTDSTPFQGETMRFVFTIQHPGNVHFFKNTINRLIDWGHEVHVFAREKEVTTDLLNAYDINYELLCSEPNGWIGLGTTQLTYELRLLQHVKRIDPDLIVASHGIAAAHVATLLGIRSLIFIDTENAVSPGNKLCVPFADVLYTPNSFRDEYGKRHITYPGLHELAYLHPDRFTPDPTVLVENGVDPNKPYVVVRFGAFQGNHDVGKRGISVAGKHKIIDELSEVGTVYVSDEAGNEPFGDARPIPIAPHRIHHLLAYADLFVGEIATMTIEAAILGTPTVRISPFAGLNEMGKFVDLERRGLVRSFPTSRETDGIRAIRRLVRDTEAGRRWKRRRTALLADTVDVTDYLIGELMRLLIPT